MVWGRERGQSCPARPPMDLGRASHCPGGGWICRAPWEAFGTFGILGILTPCYKYICRGRYLFSCSPAGVLNSHRTRTASVFLSVPWVGSSRLSAKAPWRGFGRHSVEKRSLKAEVRVQREPGVPGPGFCSYINASCFHSLFLTRGHGDCPAYLTGLWRMEWYHHCGRCPEL